MKNKQENPATKKIQQQQKDPQQQQTFGDTKRLTGNPPGKPVVSHPTSSTTIGLDDLKRSLLI